MTHSDTAHMLVVGDRNADYGSPEPDFAGIALMWSGLLNTKLKERITAIDVGLMMAALKLRRHAHKPKADNLVDAHGYLLCIEWIEGGVPPIPSSEALRERIRDLEQTIEDVAIGAKLSCDTCNRSKPCNCDHT